MPPVVDIVEISAWVGAVSLVISLVSLIFMLITLAVRRYAIPYLPRELVVPTLSDAGKSDEAVNRAWSLLYQRLTDNQRNELRTHGWFTMPGGHRKRLPSKLPRRWEYRLGTDLPRIVDSRTGRTCGYLCVHVLDPHLDIGLPLADKLLIWKCMIEGDEAQLWQVGTYHPVKPPL